MADDDSKPSGKNPTARDKGRPPGQRPFDKWLQKQLHAMYDEIASEPLPDELLNLIESDAKKNGDPPKSSSSDPK
ncbi:MAG: hypothetical protein KIT25_14625 [Enhydrobacter sp.]|nr:MAG: hypothetical protein KIT25_14625 [Enhydrobacter sp.]